MQRIHIFEPHPILSHLGWTPFFTQQALTRFADAVTPITSPERVIAEHRSQYALLGIDGTRRAVLSGKLRDSLDERDHPCVGDWVLAALEGDPARIDYVFERQSLFARKESGRSSAPQPIAANVDVAFVVTALGAEDMDPHAVRHGLSIRRIERYLRAIAESGAHAVVIVNKTDLRADAHELVRELEERIRGTDVIAASAFTNSGLAEIERRLASGQTGVFTGSSGVGKSSLLNALLGEAAQRVSPVRQSDAHGRHTTTHRELFRLPAGGLIIDTPGMREFALWADDDGEPRLTGFDDIDLIAARCRFVDCRHDSEPGCAVLTAVTRGELAEDRLEHARQLMREMQSQRERQSGLARRVARKKHRVFAKQLRSTLKAKGRK